jgi:Zn-dependent protease with chaperone function
MFYALAIALCLAVLFLVMACGSLLLAPAMRIMKRTLHSSAPMHAANTLFALRVLPLGIAGAATLGLALPAFLVFEPHSTKEGMGLRLGGLAMLGASVLAAMAVRGWRILRDTRRTQRAWRNCSQRVHLEGIGLPIYYVENGAPLLAVTGIFRPRIFVARAIAEALSVQELRAALAHEMAHVSSLDNLKQFLLKITRPPGWMAFHSADAEWTNASEIAADQTALFEGASVLDLSSALIKVGRLKRPLAVPEALASHLVPPACGSALETRITRLSELLEREQLPAPAVKRTGLALPIFLAAIAYLTCINAVLPAVHEALEFLVR